MDHFSLLQVLNWMFVHSRAYGVPLEADQYKQLLSISYDTGEDVRSQKEALTCVQIIKRVRAHVGQIMHLLPGAWATYTRRSSRV